MMILVDGHTHIHHCYNSQEFLEHAFKNLSKYHAALGQALQFTGVLMLAESAGDDYFTRFARIADAKNSDDYSSVDSWSFTRTQEECSLIASNHGKKLILIAGHQVAATEDLEVLMLGTTRKIQDGLPIRDLLQKALDLGALRVVPWGAGKWLFSRGKLLNEIIDSIESKSFFLGDEGGRPTFWPTPRHFDYAERKGIRNLPGTDPLPFPWEVCRVGTYGFWFKGSIDLAKPFASIKISVQDHQTSSHPFGRLQNPFLFIRNQYGMQKLKRAKSSFK